MMLTANIFRVLKNKKNSTAVKETPHKSILRE